MVGLPKYVKRQEKTNGRVFFYYEKFRGTSAALPRVALPADPFSVEFARRAEQCQRLAATNAGDKWNWKVADQFGRPHPLPEPRDPGFWDAVDRAEKVGHEISAGVRKTFSALIAEYKGSDAYTDRLSAGSREGYDIYLRAVDEIWGDHSVSDLTAVDAQKAIDSYKGTPSAARYFRSVLSRLIGWGIPRGYRTDNPVEHTEKIDKGGTYSPWPDWAFELFFQHARVGLHLPVYTGLYTGQRSVDVFQMVRPKPVATEMRVVQQKTGVHARVQIHSEYRRIIDAARPDGKIVALRDDQPQALHLREDGEPWTQAGFETAWQRQMTLDAEAPESEAAVAMKRLRDHRIVFHGLRKNAVINLLEVGCTEDEVGAIVGMSSAMVRHYAKEVSKHRLAINAMKKLELGWQDIRTDVLGTSGRRG